MSSDHLSRERDRYRKELADALDDDDPLAVYDRFVKWTIANYPREHAEESGLIELLEEAVRTFKDDPICRGDLRYLELWVLYAGHVDKPGRVYAYLLSKEIGAVYSQLYAQYALVLEMEGRLKDAEDVYLKGINRPCRGVAKLKKLYREFHDRVTSKATLQGTKNASSSDRNEGNSEANRLRRDPLKNFDVAKPIKPHVHQAPIPSSSSSSAFSANPYAHMTAQQPAGKRPEKLRFDLSLLFKDGKEFCIQEARARSLGLLGKKWGAPPMSEPGSHQPQQVRVEFNDGGGKAPSRNLTSNMKLTMSLDGEATVTINTKEALKDVFGMYNSPDKSIKFGSIAGTKHAPIKKVDAMKLTMARPTPITNRTAEQSENAQAGSKTPSAFRPYVDNSSKEDATPVPPKFNMFVDENSTDATPAPLKFRPFVDEIAGKPPVVTPGMNRRALSGKDAATPSAATFGKQHATNPEETPGGGMFGRVFTPAGAFQQKPREEEAKDSEDTAETGDVFHKSVLYVNPSQQPATRITPFVDAPLKVFSRPPEHPEKPSPPARGATQAQSSKGNVFRAVSSKRQALGSGPRPDSVLHHPNPTPAPSREAYSEDEDNGQVYGEHQQDAAVAEAEGEYYEEEECYQAPLGGRFGQFNVMTPITERTMEFTTSTKALSTPSDTPSLPDKAFFKHDAVEVAERLAAELREEEALERERDRIQQPNFLPQSLVEPHIDSDGGSPMASFEKSPSPPFSVSDGFMIPLDNQKMEAFSMNDMVDHTGTLSLADALAVASSFRPPNPCVPSDPQILRTLLSLIPPDPKYIDMRSENAGLLDGLQKFASKQSRRGSGNTSSGSSDVFRLQLGCQHFEVSDKLGEGGFGAVFRAKDKNLGDHGTEDDDEDVEDEDEDANMVALKVVKPRNIWEYHILRRIHGKIPAQCRPSIILPQALYAFRDESFLVLELCRQGTLLNVVNRATAAGVSQQGACLDELLVMFFAIELLKFVEGMHTAGFIHGDLKIDNCLVRLEEIPGGNSAWSGLYQASGEGGWKYKGIKMIDFGRTIDTGMFPAGQQFVSDWPTDARDCVEMREDRPWTYQNDYYGLAGIVHCMLFGKYFEQTTVVSAASPEGETRYRLAAPLKRYWQVELWTRLFDALLNPCQVRRDGSLPISPELKRLRVEMEAWLQSNCNRSSNTLKGLLKKVELAVLT